MNPIEFSEAMTGLEVMYPSLKITTNPFTMDIWYKLLQDMDRETFSAIILQHAATTRQVPAPADILNLYAGMINTETETDAWDSVMRAVRNHGSYNEAGALASLTAETRKIVQAIGWKTICLSENPGTERAHFLKMWKTERDKLTKQQCIPESLRLCLEGIENKVARIEAYKTERKALAENIG